MRHESPTLKIISMLVWVAIFLLIALCACSPQKKLNRLIKKQERLLGKYPELIVARDTLYKYDTIIKPKPITKFKPVRIIENQWDTVYQEKTKVIYSVQHDTLRFQVQCPPDTIFKESATVARTVHKEVFKMRTIQKIFFWIGLVIGLLLFGYAIARFGLKII